MSNDEGDDHAHTLSPGDPHGRRCARRPRHLGPGALPKLSAKLTGPAIGGVTPEGDAKVDQSKYPSVPPRLEVRVKNVNLPDGTTLFVGVGCEYHSCLDYRKAGTFTLRSREGSFTGALQIQVGRQTSIMVSTADGTVRLSNPDPMNP